MNLIASQGPWRLYFCARVLLFVALLALTLHVAGAHRLLAVIILGLAYAAGDGLAFASGHRQEQERQERLRAQQTRESEYSRAWGPGRAVPLPPGDPDVPQYDEDGFRKPVDF